MSALGETLRALAKAIDGLALEWYVFGAQAVSVRGAPRATQDVDVTVLVERGSIGVLADRLGAAGLQHRHPESARALLEEAALLPLNHPSGMEVDLIVGASGLERSACARAERIDVEGVNVPIASATDLVVMKTLAGRGKDLDDVRALLASGTVDLVLARDLLTQFEVALGRGDLVGTLEEAVEEVLS